MITTKDVDFLLKQLDAARSALAERPGLQSMTYEEFFELSVASKAPPPIRLQDGRMGLCNNFTESDVTVDLGKSDQIRLPYSSISDAGGGALIQIGPGESRPRGRNTLASRPPNEKADG